MRNALNTINLEELFAENEAEAIAAVTDMMVSQQNVALGLTKLVLEHCIENKISKEDLFEIYEEAFDFLQYKNEELV